MPRSTLTPGGLKAIQFLCPGGLQMIKGLSEPLCFREGPSTNQDADSHWSADEGMLGKSVDCNFE